MELIVRKKIGKTAYPFTFSGKNLFEVVFDSEKLSFPDVLGCGLCKSDNLRLHAYKAGEENYEYTKIVCNDCGGSLTFGQTKKDPNTFYLRKTDGVLDWVARETKKENLPPEPTAGAMREREIDEGLPF